MNLQQVFKFTDNDVQANKNGYLSPSQQQRYLHFQKVTNRYANCGWIGGIFSLLIVASMFLGLIYFVVIQQEETNALPVFGFVFGILLLLISYSLGRTYVQQRRTNRNINEQRVHLIEGPLAPIYVDEEVHGVEVYAITIIPYDGSLSRQVLDVIEPHAVYRVYYLPVSYGNILLSVEALS